MTSKLLEIFNSHFASSYGRLLQPGMKFIHYTSPEAALSIIKSQKFWLRDTTVMNDASEVYHGTKLVKQYFGGEKGTPFFDCLDRVETGFSDRLKQLYDAWVSDLETNTYVACLSEHNVLQDQAGCLSMWRAYGARGGVGLVLDPYFAELQTDHLQTYSYPILYMEDERAFAEFDEFSKRIVLNEQYLKSQNVEEVFGWCFNALQTFGLCLKHPAFEEEREWRIIHRPNAHPSDAVLPSTQTINGTPQLIYELPIDETSRDDDMHITIDRLLDHIIIGPCDVPEVVAKALIAELRPFLSVEKIEQVIRFSNIPLRR